MPIRGLGNLFEDLVAVHEEVGHVAAKKEMLGEVAEDGDGGGEAEDVLHFGFEGGDAGEAVVVLHGAEGALLHGVLEVSGAIVCGDFAGEVLDDAKVAGSPADLIAETHKTGGDAGNGLFAGPLGAEEVDFNGAGQVEAAFHGGGDAGCEIESDHARDASCSRLCGCLGLRFCR